jgi:hypothetical protein
MAVFTYSKLFYIETMLWKYKSILIRFTLQDMENYVKKIENTCIMSSLFNHLKRLMEKCTENVFIFSDFH